MKIKTAIAQGRFHILHWGHMEYLMEAKRRCKYLIIGITDCDPERSYFKYNDNLRKFDENNLLTPFRSIDNPIFPFTFYDRMRMIKDSLIEEGVDPKEFDIVPFPIHKIEFLKYYIPLNAVIFATIYDEWGRKKVEMLKNNGFKVEILWERDMNTRFTTATEVRKRILNNKKWDHLVPQPVYNYIISNNLDKILRKNEK